MAAAIIWQDSQLLVCQQTDQMKAGNGLTPSRAFSVCAARRTFTIETPAELNRRPLPFPSRDREQTHVDTSQS